MLGNRRVKGAHIGAKKGPTGVHGFTGCGWSFEQARKLWSCSSTAFGLPWRRRVKRSRALRGRNPTRDNLADGAPMALLRVALNHQVVEGPFHSIGHRTPELCLRKSTVALAATSPLITRSSCLSSSSTRGSGSFRCSSRRSDNGASADPAVPRSSDRPGRFGPIR